MNTVLETRKLISEFKVGDSISYNHDYKGKFLCLRFRPEKPSIHGRQPVEIYVYDPQEDEIDIWYSSRGLDTKYYTE